jgi:hypothetical protein
MFSPTRKGGIKLGNGEAFVDRPQQTHPQLQLNL